MLANVGGDAPARLWDRIAEQATRPGDAPAGTLPIGVVVGIRDDERVAPAEASSGAASPQRRRRARPGTATRLAVAVCAVAAAVLGIQVAVVLAPAADVEAALAGTGPAAAPGG